MASLPSYDRYDYIYIGGKSGRYAYTFDPDITISRRQYENLRAKEEGWENASQRERAHKSPNYHRWLRKARELGLDDDIFNFNYSQAEKDNWDKGMGRAFWGMLRDLEYYDDSSDWDVGETPKEH